MTPAVGLLAITASLLMQGCFSGSEIALVGADRLRLETRAQQGDTGASLALALLSREDRMLATCLIGTNLCVVAGTTAVSYLLWQRGFEQEWLVALCYAPFALMLGEALPKSVFQHHATALAPYVARFVRAAQVLFTPALWLVGAWATLLSRLIGSNRRAGLTRQEILWLLQEPRSASIHPDDQKMIQRVFAITETMVEECMTPLVDVDAVPISASVREAMEVAVRNGHSRLPVYEDRVDHIVGIVHAQDLLFGGDDGRVGLDDTVRAVLRPVKYVPDSKRVDELLNEMRREREHFAVVVDEYGGSVGILTIEDLLEEIIGEIRDERDTDEEGIRRVSETEWRLPARVEVEPLEHAIGRELPDGDYETVAGLILQTTGRIPAKGEIVKVGELLFRIEDANERAILTVHLTVPKLPARLTG